MDGYPVAVVSSGDPRTHAPDGRCASLQYTWRLVAEQAVGSPNVLIDGQLHVLPRTCRSALGLFSAEPVVTSGTQRAGIWLGPGQRPTATGHPPSLVDGCPGRAKPRGW